MPYTSDYSEKINRIKTEISSADAIVVGAGAGLSTAAGYTYSGKRFHENFHDFEMKYGFTDMYSGGFYPFPTPEEKWAFWSRNILINRYTPTPVPLYEKLLSVLKGKDYFVVTTNVDHCFQRAGFDKERLFYTQGDYGLFQCGKPCHKATYDNEDAVRRMVAEQRDMKIPSGLVPRCPVCGREMAMNLRADDTFVEDDGWRKASARYSAFIGKCEKKRVVFLELGVGGNTPVIIKYPFWRMTYSNKKSVYICVNRDEAVCPEQISDRSVLVGEDIAEVIRDLA